jgi:hypothetical protein
MRGKVIGGFAGGDSDSTSLADPNRWGISGVALLLLFAAFRAAPGLARSPPDLPSNLPWLAPGTKIDMSLPYFKEWPNGNPALFKVRNDLILAVPPQYQKFWRQGKKAIRLPAPASAIPARQAPGVSFSFFLPGFTGYTPENYEKSFDPGRVDVVELQPADPNEIRSGAIGEFPPNMRKRAFNGLLSRNSARSLYGLTCYRYSYVSWETNNRVECYGVDKLAGDIDVMLYGYLPPYESWNKFPIIQARYFTSKYGGVRIVWRTSARNFSRWQEYRCADLEIHREMERRRQGFARPSFQGAAVD